MYEDNKLRSQKPEKAEVLNNIRLSYRGKCLPLLCLSIPIRSQKNREI